MADYITFNFERNFGQFKKCTFSFIVKDRDTILQMKMNELIMQNQDANKKIVFSVSKEDDQKIKDGSYVMLIHVGSCCFPLDTFKQMTVKSVMVATNAANTSGTVDIKVAVESVPIVIVGGRDLWDD
jgi:hypothetical protein